MASATMGIVTSMIEILLTWGKTWSIRREMLLANVNLPLYRLLLRDGKHPSRSHTANSLNLHQGRYNLRENS